MFSNPSKNISELNLETGMKVADFGAGSGFYAKESARAVGATGKVYAIDVQKDLLSRIKDEANHLKLFNVEVVWGDVTKEGGTTLRDGLLDAVIVSNLLFQVEDKDGVAKEAVRVLKPGAKVLIVEWSNSFGGLGPEQKSVVSKEKATEVFERNGFSLEQEINAGEQHYGLVLRKK